MLKSHNRLESKAGPVGKSRGAGLWNPDVRGLARGSADQLLLALSSTVVALHAGSLEQPSLSKLVVSDCQIIPPSLT